MSNAADERRESTAMRSEAVGGCLEEASAVTS